MLTANRFASCASSAERHPADWVCPATLIVGLGNPLRGDDGVGLVVIDRLQGEMDGGASGEIELDGLSVGGLTLMERLVGHRRVILVDAVSTGTVPLGTVRAMTLDDLDVQRAEHLDSAHDISLSSALSLGRTLGADLPDRIDVVAIEVAATDTFADGLSPSVAAAVPAAVTLCLRMAKANS